MGLFFFEEELESEKLPSAEETSAGPSLTAGFCGRGTKPPRGASDCPAQRSQGVCFSAGLFFDSGQKTSPTWGWGGGGWAVGTVTNHQQRQELPLCP